MLLDVAAPCVRILESKQEKYLGMCKRTPAKQLIKVSVFIIFSTKVGTDYHKIIKLKKLSLVIQFWVAFPSMAAAIQRNILVVNDIWIMDSTRAAKHAENRMVEIHGKW